MIDICSWGLGRSVSNGFASLKFPECLGLKVKLA